MFASNLRRATSEVTGLAAAGVERKFPDGMHEFTKIFLTVQTQVRVGVVTGTCARVDRISADVLFLHDPVKFGERHLHAFVTSRQEVNEQCTKHCSTVRILRANEHLLAGRLAVVIRVSLHYPTASNSSTARRGDVSIATCSVDYSPHRRLTN